VQLAARKRRTVIYDNESLTVLTNMARLRPSRGRQVKACFGADALATRLPLLLDIPGLFFVEARRRMHRAKKSLTQLLLELQSHAARVQRASTQLKGQEADDAWSNIIRQIGQLEALFGSTINDFLVADVLLVASAEAYINAIADHVLPTAEAQQFDKLSPVGKWLILPRIMKLKWKPQLSSGSLQEFAAVVARRNRVVHPKLLIVEGTAAVATFLKQLRLDARVADAGIKAVRDLFQQISLAWRGSYGPDWPDQRKYRVRPPCFVFGGAQIAARLGRARRLEADT